jgi:cobalamin biosynthesis Mg chelatase CobN
MSPGIRRGVALLAAAVALVGAIGLAVAAPASAHGEEGVIEIDEPEATGDLTVGVRILLTYENDAEPVASDEVGEITAVGVGPAGETFGPEGGFEASEVPGVYVADLTFPTAGAWELTISSDVPTATATTTVDVTAAQSDGGEADASDDSDEVDAGSETAEPVEAEIVERGSGGDGPTPLLITLLLAGVVLVAGIVGAVYLRRRGRST